MLQIKCFLANYYPRERHSTIQRARYVSKEIQAQRGELWPLYFTINQ